MAYELVHEDDWSSYGTDAEAVEDAYVVWDGSDPPFALNGGAVGPTSGPNGGPGLVDLSGNAGTLPKNLPMVCRQFKIELLADYTGHAGVGIRDLFAGWYGDPYSASMSEFSDMLFTVSHNPTVGNVVVTANPSYNSGSVAAGITGLTQWRLEGQLSTISGTAGSFTAAADGYIKLYANDVLIVDSGPIALWHDDATIPSINEGGGYSPYWNIVELGTHGRVGLYRVYASDDCEEEPDPVVDQSVACCATTPDTPGGVTPHAGTTPEADPTRPLPVWEAHCVGGGTVPSASDVANAENWSA